MKISIPVNRKKGSGTPSDLGCGFGESSERPPPLQRTTLQRSATLQRGATRDGVPYERVHIERPCNGAGVEGQQDL
jgi:hypothetical protein